jgi:hypothetical protein
MLVVLGAAERKLALRVTRYGLVFYSDVYSRKQAIAKTPLLQTNSWGSLQLEGARLQLKAWLLA